MTTRRSLTGLFFLLLALLATATGGAAQELSLEEGQDVWRSCSSCHCVTDRRIPQDADWLKLNLTTTCISGVDDTPETRRALNAYLSAETTLRPLLVDEEHPPEAGLATGRLRVPATAGSAYLKADRESVRAGSPPRVRLRWQASDEGKTLVVPAGSYRVISYAFYRVDAEKRRWALAGSSAEGCADLVVAAEKEAVFALLPEFRSHPKSTGEEEGDGYELSFFMTNERGERTTIARDGELVNPTWLIRDEKGAIVDRGDFAVT